MARIIHVALSAATVFAIALFVIATLKNDVVEEEGQTKRFHLLGNHHHDQSSSYRSADDSSIQTSTTTVVVNETSSNKSLHDTTATTTNHLIKDEEEGLAYGSNAASPQEMIASSSNDIPEQQQQQNPHQQIDEVDDDGSSSSTDVAAFSLKEITAMRKKLAPREMLRNENGDPLAHQFLHLHHMKTGGTSMDGLIRCGLLRFKRMYNNNASGIIPYTQIHECGPQHYQDCKSGKSASCLQAIQQASVMSYCAPLRDLDIFGWNNENHHTTTSTNGNNNENSPSNGGSSDIGNVSVDDDEVLLNSIGAVTVIRHPVARVWSMYRFQTKTCYQCRSLQDVYTDIDNGVGFNSDAGKGCANQLRNHLTRNLLLADAEDSRSHDNTTTTTTTKTNDTDRQVILIQQAIANLNSFFTIVGLTEELDTTAKMVGMVFPWLDKKLNGSETECPLPRSNVSPENNHCGPDGKSHMPLPDYPDEATVKLIEQHNQLDFHIYQAAVKRFNLQKEAMGIA